MTMLRGLDELFEDRHLGRKDIVLCARRYRRFKLSSRNLLRMMTEQGEAMVRWWRILLRIIRLIASVGLFRSAAGGQHMAWFPAMALLGLAVAIAAVPASIAVADPSEPATVPAATRTGKERLTDKASDEQRLDDCKVPRDRRTRTRPTSCPWDAGS